MSDHPIYTGKTSVTSEIQPLGYSVSLRWGVQIYSDTANTSAIYIVEPGKTIDDGYPIYPGERLEIRVDDLAKVYLTSASSGGSGVGAQELRYLAW